MTLEPMASGIKIYSVFQISEIITVISKKKLFWISRNTYVFRMSNIIILDIKNNSFGYQKISIYLGYPKFLFWISEIVIFDI